MLKLATFLLVTLAAGPALAGASAWQEIAPGVTARLISSDSVVAGKTLAGLELSLPPGSRTYWRIPGETGIPTEFDFSGSAGLGDPAVAWPYPQIDHSEGVMDYIYSGVVVLPVHLTVSGDAATLDAAVTLGICSDICVPAQARFSLPLSFQHPDAAQTLRLNQALAVVPIPWDQPTPAFTKLSITPDGSDLVIAGLDRAIDPASIIADAGDPALLFAAPKKSPDGAILALKLLGDASATGLEGRSVQLTFMTAMGPYAVVAIVAHGAS